VTDASLLFFPYTFLLRARMECTAFRNSLISSSRIARIAREFKWKTKSAHATIYFTLLMFRDKTGDDNSREDSTTRSR